MSAPLALVETKGAPEGNQDHYCKHRADWEKHDKADQPVHAKNIGPVDRLYE
jgi:hypothetical protein